MTNETHILLVNNNPDVRQLLRMTLSEAGYSCISEASCGLEAVQTLRSTPIDLLVTDIELPKLDGWRLARLVRSGIFLCESNTPVIVVTKTWCERIAETTAREFGINDLLGLEHLDRLPDVLSSCLKTPIEVFRNPRVLMVEDHQDTAQVAKRVLRQRFDVEVATNGEAGLEAWKQRRHELVLLDVMLPKMSGPDVLRRIMAIDRNQPVVIMTAHSTIELAEELMLEGAADFIAKPFRAEQLRRVCELAARREDYLVSNAQFAQRLQSLQESTDAFRMISEAHQRLLDSLSTVVIELDSTGRLRFLNQAWKRLTGYSIEESLDRPLFAFLPLDGEGGAKDFKSRFDLLLRENGGEDKFELCLLHRQGQVLWAECRLDAISSEKEGMAVYGCLDNISERKKAQNALEFLTVHDNLTGLFNRHYLQSAVRQAATSSARKNGSHSLMYIDLDHFKVINDTFGHYHGDAVLQEISNLFGSRLRKSDTLCRIGGDEFAVLLANADQEEARQIAEKIRQAVQSFQYIVGGQQIGVGCSIGLSEIDGRSSNPEEYLKRADTALYVAKRRGRNRIHVYDPEDREGEELRSSVGWVRRLRQAVAEDHLSLFFQPVLHIGSGRIVHYEALLRLEHPDQGLVLPGKFIPALEQAGEMPMLDHWVIRRAIRMLKEYPGLHRVAINLSAQAFRDEELVPLVEEELRLEGVDPGRIIFELTESASLSNISATQRMIERLNEIGCGFAVDDFGTGFSTFGYLKQFPADFIKVDGSFITHIDQNPVDQALVRAICEVAQALGKQTVAEAVENETVFNRVKELGIDYAQGYHIGHPLPVESLKLDKAKQPHPKNLN